MQQATHHCIYLPFQTQMNNLRDFPSFLQIKSGKLHTQKENEFVAVEIKDAIELIPHGNLDQVEKYGQNFFIENKSAKNDKF